MIIKLINFLTALRILLAAVISLLLIFGDGYLLALSLFFFAGLTDYLDGYFARKYNATSEIGEILDPIADKILVVFILIILSVNLHSFLLAFSSALIISREIWVSALRDFSARKNILKATKVTYLAKLKTVLQMVAISILLTGETGNKIISFQDYNAQTIGIILLWLSAFLTLYTGYDYLRKGIDHAINEDSKD